MSAEPIFKDPLATDELELEEEPEAQLPVEEGEGTPAYELRFAEACHQRVLATEKRSFDLKISAGLHLIAAKELLSHGEWLTWLQQFTTMPSRTASRYMKMAKAANPDAAWEQEHQKNVTRHREEREHYTHLKSAAAAHLDDTAEEAEEIEERFGAIEERNKTQGEQFRTEFLPRLANLNREEFLLTLRALDTQAIQLGVTFQERFWIMDWVRQLPEHALRPFSRIVASLGMS